MSITSVPPQAPEDEETRPSNYKASRRAIKVLKEQADLRAWLLLAAKEQYGANNTDLMRAFGMEHEGALFNALYRARKRRAAWEADKTANENGSSDAA